MGRANRSLIALGAFALLVACILGAYGSHGLRPVLTPEAWNSWQTAIQYHFHHGLGVIAAALVAERIPSSRLAAYSGWFLFAGIILFSGSIYATTFGAPSFVGALAPFGGMSFMLGWATLGIGILRAR
jgi:uncharacterized membrane protein YgdD (TMEM256/DUF423 family)